MRLVPDNVGDHMRSFDRTPQRARRPENFAATWMPRGNEFRMVDIARLRSSTSRLSLDYRVFGGSEHWRSEQSDAEFLCREQCADHNHGPTRSAMNQTRIVIENCFVRGTLALFLRCSRRAAILSFRSASRRGLAWPGLADFTDRRRVDGQTDVERPFFFSV